MNNPKAFLTFYWYMKIPQKTFCWYIKNKRVIYGMLIW